MRYSFSRNPFINRGIIVLILGILTYLLMMFADHPHAVERYYSQGLYPIICYLLHPVLNLLPFSLGDVVYVAVVLMLLYITVRIFKLLFTKKFAGAAKSAMSVIIGVQAAILIFYLFWGMNYFRPPAAERLGLKDSTFTTADLETVTAILIDSANISRARLTHADLQQSNDTIYSTALKAVKVLANSSPNFKTNSPGIKPSLLTPIMNYIGTSGYYNPFTTEAQMNYQMPVFNRPFVACHEMSHQMGYGPEDEANFVGYLASTTSKDKLLRYSGYYLAMEEFMHSLRRVDSVSFKQLKLRISPAVKNDLKQERLYWLSYQNKINAVTSVFYDNFLKANNQPEGLETYNRMVSLVMAMYKEKKWTDQLPKLE